jgi:outer membrane lipoprotein-sorting protein
LSPLLFAALTLALADAPHPTRADPPAPVWGLAQLMAGMQTVRRASATFVELKFVQMLKQPLQTSGRLIYVAPDRLQKETLGPAPSGLIVTGDHLTVQQPDGKLRELSLSEFPEIGALIESIRATLAGDIATLSRYYTAVLTGTPGDWSLQLQPRDERLRKLLTMVRIQGEGTSIRAVETLEHDGDRSEMTITPDPG